VTDGGGRFIDPRLGSLEGEGAQQIATEEPEALKVWAQAPSAARHPGDSTYYELPAIKEPVWIWAVPAYFFVGGAAGAAGALGSVAQAIDPDALGNLILNCRRIEAVGTAAGTALLIVDLGRPERFLNMLRVFRPTSPLSVGSWILAAATPLAATSLILVRANGVLRRLGEAMGMAAGLLGVPLAGYTAVLLSNTAVPLWANIRRTLPALFVSSATSSATSLLGFANLNRVERKIVDRVEIAATAAELVSTLAVERDANRVEEVGRPLQEGMSGRLWNASTVCGMASLALSLLPGRAGRARPTRLVSSVLGTVGSAAMRFAIFYAGKASSRSPRATFHTQRAGLGGAEVTGRPAISGPRARASEQAPR
jgi:formate-dependent nitrite reductase membrane component NrfD